MFLPKTSTNAIVIGTSRGIAGTSGSILFIDSSGNVAQNNANFFWDNTNSRVGIGTTGPGYPLHVKKDSATLASYMTIENGTNFTAGDDIAAMRFIGKNSGGTQVQGIVGVDTFFTSAATGDFVVRSVSNHPLVFGTNNTEKVRIDTAGNVGIGTTGPGTKLHVYSSDSDITGTIETDGANKLARLTLSNPERDLIITNNALDDLWSFSYGGANRLQFDTSNQWFNSGNVGIGTTSPTNLLSFGGNSARIFWLERHTTSNTQGNTLTITAGGATAGATDKNGGDLLLQGGLSTGTGESGVQIYGCVAGASGTADRTQTLAIQILGNKIGFYNTTPVAQQTGVAVTIAAVHAALVNLGLITA